MNPLVALAALLVAAATVCLAEVTLRPSRALSTRVAVNNIRDSRAFAAVDEDVQLLDIVLVASVDGKLHALNRTSGAYLWSMASAGSTPSAFGPLISSEPPEWDPDLTDDDDARRETYVIEPQSGDIYVMSSPTSPLQRLPFSMSQLVDMSPFRFTGDDGNRVFVGRKETSLLVMGLETGKVKATMDSNCPWQPFEDPVEDEDIDLDELEGSKPPKSTSPVRDIHIGRTDYYLTIRTDPKSPGGRPHIQKLSFSTYGPNNQDNTLQSLYQHTADNTYIQSLPTGKIISFRAAGPDSSETSTNAHPLWFQQFSNPIIATFDVLHSSKREQPFVLLQPQPRLEDLLPSDDLVFAARHKMLPNLDAAYVGLLEESGSLFAMSPDRFPLVVFSDSSQDKLQRIPSIDAPPRQVFHEGDDAVPPDLETIKKRAKQQKLWEECRNGSMDIRCLTGIKKLGADSQSRLSRLLEAVPLKQNDSDRREDPVDVEVIEPVPRQPGWSNGSESSPPEDVTSRRLPGMSKHTQALSAFALCAIILLVWVSVRKFFSPVGQPLSPPVSVPTAPEVSDETTKPVAELGLATPSEKANGNLEPALSSDDALTSSPELTPAKRVLFVPDALAPVEGAISDVAEGEDSEKEGDGTDTPGKRKGIRRKRGKKKKGAVAIVIPAEDVEHSEPTATPDSPLEPVKNVVSSILLTTSTPPVQAEPTLVVSDSVLGMGSHGTVVFKGSLQGRAVAVKRMLADFVTLASREVNILQESDDHPNVIRYYYQEAHANFLYIALELCPASLADLIERPDAHRDIAVAFDPKRALRQITLGLRHLHALKIVHRDIKPQNILVSAAKPGRGENAGHRMLISDFGLCKKLEMDQTSFLPTAHGAVAAGTVGWRAPEILRGEVKLDDAGDESQSSRGSVGGSSGGSTGTPSGKPTRLTKSVDIFALGCLYYYVLTNGCHPFGDRFEREFNILKNSKCLDGLERLGEEGVEGVDLITRMLNPEAYERPDTSTCLTHPYYWDQGRRLAFLGDASDRFEVMVRDPKDAHLLALERGAINIVGPDWHARLDKLFIENLGKFRKYDGASVQDLLRALRNKKNHYQDLPDNVKRLLGSMPEGFLGYFTKRFPKLFLHVHGVIGDSILRTESMFRSYYELRD
ncbi:uncharacterized protein BXZ73DRAFT_48589 [Epithele typhae]|uniref:uncharacterized protein n=1 Tax=Epithele typhae TaxID=378194 RepID=UPI002007DBA7|nr:uncharacterized protein BXZ73DRAFT_48589 [Epithele typhae]KAH9927939.1 hypothetical protein BXZ73DRAFT_48589 [Epithele typhae]